MQESGSHDLPTHELSGIPGRPFPRLHIADVSLKRGSTQVFQQLELRLDESHIGLIGHNGAGKTSLLRLLCGLEAPDRGSVRRNGADIHSEADARQRARWIGMMFQNPDDQIIFPIVEEELALGLQPRGLKKREAIAQARSFLEGRGLAHWAARPVASLSHGQRQHVCWLAMLLAGPVTLLLDEPYASLDLPGQARLAEELRQSDRQLIVSTHLLDHVRPYPRVIWLDEGKIRADGDGQSVCAAYEAEVRRLVGQAAARTMDNGPTPDTAGTARMTGRTTASSAEPGTPAPASDAGRHGGTGTGRTAGVGAGASAGAAAAAASAGPAGASGGPGTSAATGAASADTGTGNRLQRGR